MGYPPFELVGQMFSWNPQGQIHGRASCCRAAGPLEDLWLSQTRSKWCRVSPHDQLVWLEYLRKTWKKSPNHREDHRLFQVFFPFKPTVDAEIAPAFPLSPCSAEQGEDHQSLGGNPSEKVNTYEYIIYTWLKTHEKPYFIGCVYIYIYRVDHIHKKDLSYADHLVEKVYFMGHCTGKSRSRGRTLGQTSRIGIYQRFFQIDKWW